MSADRPINVWKRLCSRPRSLTLSSISVISSRYLRWILEWFYHLEHSKNLRLIDWLIESVLFYRRRTRTDIHGQNSHQICNNSRDPSQSLPFNNLNNFYSPERCRQANSNWCKSNKIKKRLTYLTENIYIKSKYTDRCQMILLGDRRARVWTTCLRFLPPNIPNVPLSGNNLTEVVPTYVPLKPSSIIW